MANCVFYKVWSSGGECTFPDMHSADRQVHLAKDVPTEDGPTQNFPVGDVVINY